MEEVIEVFEKLNIEYKLVKHPVDKKADLKKISDGLGSSRLSFGNEEELWEKLHIKPGSVSILNVIGAPDTDVTFVLDKELVGAGFVSFHPNDNTASIAFDEKNIQKIMDEYNKTLLFMEVEG